MPRISDGECSKKPFASTSVTRTWRCIRNTIRALIRLQRRREGRKARDQTSRARLDLVRVNAKLAREEGATEARADHNNMRPCIDSIRRLQTARSGEGNSQATFRIKNQIGLE